jgi:hypothetical protein
MTLIDPDSLTSEAWGLIPGSVTPPTVIDYWVAALDMEGKSGTSITQTFSVLTPEHPDARVLFADDMGYDVISGNDTSSAGKLYEEVLDSIGIEYETWSIAEHRGIDASITLYGWDAIIWGGGMPLFTLPSALDSTAEVLDDPIVQYLDNGGCFFFSAYRYFSYNFGETTIETFSPGYWMYDYMGVLVGKKDIGLDTIFAGIESDPVSGHWATTPFVIKEWFHNQNNDGADAGDITGANTIFTGLSTTEASGVKFNNSTNGSKVVFLPWPFEAATVASDVLPNGINLMAQVLNWFGITGIGETEARYVFNLSQSSPNPFAKETNIMYQIPTKSRVSLKIYDITGRFIKTLVNGDRESGSYTVRWDGTNENGIYVPNGIYFYKLQAQKKSAIGKLILMR